MVRRVPSASAPSTMSRPSSSMIRVASTSAAGTEAADTEAAGGGVDAGCGTDRVVMVPSGCSSAGVRPIQRRSQRSGRRTLVA
jgi:hypothetical protein